MGKRVLLVNPPILDFAAYDFWLKPYGMLRAAGFLRGQAELSLFDYLDRLSPHMPASPHARNDEWGRGSYYSERQEKPKPLADIPRNWRRYGIPRATFHRYLREHEPADFALIQTVMTYWYPGVKEVIEDLRCHWPQTRIVLGGVYSTLCPDHARSLGPDHVIEGLDLNPLYQILDIQPDLSGLPSWELYPKLETGIMKLTDGCPFKCTYCSVPQVYPSFQSRPMDQMLREFDFLCERGARHIAFYDDALLYRPKEILMPFLEAVRKRKHPVYFHCPNALNARFIDEELATAMIESGFRKIYLGFESSKYEWQRKTGGKVYSHELPRAIEHLASAGLDREHICAYLILGHPQSDQQDVESALRFASDCGIRSMLADFSPIPGTPDGEACRSWIDLDEPLHHNKTSFPIRFLGSDETNRMKALCKELNRGPNRLCSTADLC